MSTRKPLSEIAKDRRIKVGSVVQLNEHASDECFVGCLLIVTEVGAWGVQGFVTIPQKKEEPAPRAFLRLRWNQIEYVGTAVLMPVEPEEQGEQS